MIYVSRDSERLAKITGLPNKDQVERIDRGMRLATPASPDCHRLADAPEELTDKFFALATRVWDRTRAEAIFDACMSLEHVKDVRTVLPAPIHPEP